MQSKYGRISTDCNEVVLRGSPGKAVVKVTNHSNGSRKIYLWPSKGTIMVVFDKWFEFNGRISKDGDGKLDIGPNQTVEIRLQLKSSVGLGTDVRPDRLHITNFSSDKLSLPIQYSSASASKSAIEPRIPAGDRYPHPKQSRIRARNSLPNLKPPLTPPVPMPPPLRTPTHIPLPTQKTIGQPQSPTLATDMRNARPTTPSAPNTSVVQARPNAHFIPSAPVIPVNLRPSPVPTNPLMITKVPPSSQSFTSPMLPRRYGCNQCHKPARYICTSCDPEYWLCFGCVGRYGRESHFAQFGEGHWMQYSEDLVKCYSCKTVPVEKFHVCHYCEWHAPSRAILCRTCFSSHSNVNKHMKENYDRHFFRIVDSLPAALREAQPFYHQPNERVACTPCNSKLSVGSEFLRCIDCDEATREIHSNAAAPYHLCARCANEGGIHAHVAHRFEFVALTVIASPNPASPPRFSPPGLVSTPNPASSSTSPASAPTPSFRPLPLPPALSHIPIPTSVLTIVSPPVSPSTNVAISVSPLPSPTPNGAMALSFASPPQQMNTNLAMSPSDFNPFASSRHDSILSTVSASRDPPPSYSLHSANSLEGSTRSHLGIESEVRDGDFVKTSQRAIGLHVVNNAEAIGFISSA